jgi:hypothetical protein
VRWRALHALGWALDAVLAVADWLARRLAPLEDDEPDDPLATA